MPIKAGSATKPIPGYQVEILNELGENMPANQQGFFALERPLPPSCLPTVWRNHDRFESGYLRQFPVTTCPVMAVILMTTGISSSWDVLMM